MPTRLWSVVFDAKDHRALASFWAETLDWRLKHDVDYSSVSEADGFLPRLEFAPVPEEKASKNRVHFDLPTDSDDEKAETVERLTRLGARRIDIGQPKDAGWVVLADPEGNEFCVTGRPPWWVGTGHVGAIAYDATDSAVLGRFWSAATGWPIVGQTEQMVVLRSPNSVGPFITVSGPPERVAAKPVKNRVHLDVAPYAVDDQSAEVDRLVRLGAREIDIGQGDVPWVVMADPEDNEFCVLTPR